MRLSNFLIQQANITKGRKPYPIRLTPGQWTEFQQEQPGATTLRSDLGVHPVSRIELETRATGNNVILAPREDVFAEVESDTGIQLVSLSNEVTSVPDNIACVEVVSVGELVTNVTPGQLAFLDFYDCKQGYILANDELYIAGSEAFKALFDVQKQVIIPLANYVVTRRQNDRMKVGLTGTDRVHLPDYTLCDGIAGGRTTQGDAATHVLYEEVVSVGPLTKRALPGQMTAVERWVLDCLASGDFMVNPLVEALQAERSEGRTPDIKAGELVVFCDEIAVKLRVRGEVQHLIPYDNILAVIADDKILAASIRKGQAGKLISVCG